MNLIKKIFLIFSFISIFTFGVFVSFYHFKDVKAQSQNINLDLKTPGNNSIVDSPQVIVTGKTVPSGDVFVNQNELKADNQGNFVSSVMLDEGINSIVVVVNDENGNYLEKELTVKLQTAASP